ncbi:alpha-1A adrenergic receptor-like [Dendronephthya gigantea]|uniref:alpha-1A adrenergic receptor-like n=1 Tax=Dendronephthya gigantea TaxID=151771 RepID=UPI00106B8733|nr:alpha-1A adrenergic receptor-like [Dendronephthya gigantea]
MMYSSIFSVSICIFGVIAHMFLFVAFIKDPLKCFKNSGTYLVGNLAISDLLTSLISPIYFVHRHFLGTWHSVLLFAKHVCMSESIFTIAIISMDRFLMTVYPIKYRILMEGKRLIVWLICTWLISFGISTKVFLLDPLNKIGEVATLVINFFAGAVIIFSCVMYGLTYYKLKKQYRNFAPENISNRQGQARVMKEKRFLRTISFVACIQIVCILPSATFFNFRIFQAPLMDSPSAWITTHILYGLFYLNFAVNPLVYIWRLPNYRKTFYLLYCCKL